MEQCAGSGPTLLVESVTRRIMNDAAVEDRVVGLCRYRERDADGEESEYSSDAMSHRSCLPLNSLIILPPMPANCAHNGGF